MRCKIVLLAVIVSAFSAFAEGYELRYVLSALDSATVEGAEVWDFGVCAVERDDAPFFARISHGVLFEDTGERCRAPSGQPFLFAAKERQNLGGDYLFGPRNLISSALIWDRPDLMAGQYPSVSPWTYCASNPIRYTDPTGNRLVISENLSDEEFGDIFNDLQQLTNHRLTTARREGFIEVLISEFNFGNKPYGNALISSIINDKRKVLIDAYDTSELYTKYDRELNQYWSREAQYLDPSPQERINGGVINLAPHTFPKVLEEVFDERIIPAHIILAHELIHNLHYLQDRKAIGEAFNPYSPISTSFEEAVTVGLYPNPLYPLTENAIRKEHGLPLRLRY